ncbi:hypothetical protein K438DRAFT_2028961 [Mycena galopus ATCC 62051]|nr:hypothetical protein K438DRAFT_2028961 [Mycena galopus ATCC 62051]
MLDPERTYMDLIFRATKKYGAWDPEITVKVGDYGKISRGPRGLAFWRKNGTFVRQGNIYTDGKAERFDVPAPAEYGREAEGQTWITSLNATQMDASLSAGSSGRGAVLAMENAMVTIIDPPGALRRLLEDPSMRGMVVVSEVHSCSSYARLLTGNKSGTFVLGLQVPPPVADVVSASANGTWVRQGATGNFKSHVDKKGERVFCPLFRLVSRSEEEASTGIGAVDPR